jgi:hypothetical protein
VENFSQNSVNCPYTKGVSEKELLFRVTIWTTLGSGPFQYLEAGQQTSYYKVCPYLKNIITGEYIHGLEFAWASTCWIRLVDVLTTWYLHMFL